MVFNHDFFLFFLPKNNHQRTFRIFLVSDLMTFNFHTCDTLGGGAYFCASDPENRIRIVIEDPVSGPVKWRPF